jgi:hypothetical protein
MSDEKIEAARLVRDNFFEDLDSLRTFDDYRQFMIKYFSSHLSYEEINLLLTTAEMKNVPIGTFPSFKKFFRDTAYNEFFRKKDKFNYEEIQLGFMK